MFLGREPGWRTRLSALAVVFAVTGWASSARADGESDQPSLGLSVGAGCVLALGAMAGGGAVAASSSRERTRKTGFEILAGGLVLAPVVSHGLAHEWKRAAVFGAVTAALAGTAVGLLEGSGEILDFGRPATRVPFGAALAVELMVSGAGLSDSLMAGERARARRVALMPLVSRGAVGVSLGGVL